MVEVEAEDDQGLASLGLFWETDVDSGLAELVRFGEVWAGGIPGQPPDTVVSWWIEASDGINTSQTDLQDFRVRLLAPEDLAGPEGRIIDVEAGLTWSAPSSIHDLESYRVYRGGELVAEPEIEGAIVAVDGDGLDVFAVSAVYDVGEGDLSEELSLDVYRPRVETLDPSSAWQGDLLRLDLLGEYLLLVDGEVEAELGVGITIESIEVLDVDRAELLVRVETDATVGLRDLALTTAGVEVELAEAFMVLDGAGRPSIESIEPDSLRQGDQETVVITLSEPPGSEEVVVDLGDGVVVEAVRVREEEVSVDVVVDPLAPLGVRGVVVDDGLRLVSGAELRVRDALPPDTSCAHVALGPWFLLLFLVGRRR